MAEAKKKLSLKDLQKHQPSLATELRAWVREGREDLLATLMGPLAGVTREPGAPGTPTPQQVTEALQGRKVDGQTDQLTGDAKRSISELADYAKAKAAEAMKRMENGSDRGQDHSPEL